MRSNDILKTFSSEKISQADRIMLGFVIGRAEIA